MQFSQATIAAFAALLPFLTLTNGHMLMDQPGVYADGLDPMPPLDFSGSNFPCSISDFKIQGTPPTLNPGEQGSIHLFGSAVHAGGSCQVSITYDQPPTRNSVWKALKSWETGCPVQADGNLPDLQDPKLTPHAPLTYTLPADLPAGKGTVAWTWFNREGNREMYMRCHAATIGGSNTSTAGFDKLPHMYVANIAPAQCEVPRMVNLKFPNPAPETQGAGDGAGVGAGCGKPIGAQGNAPPAGGNDNPPPPPVVAPPPAENKEVNPPVQVVQPQVQNGGGSCTAGQTKCSGNSWSMCAHGAWVNMGALAPGTDCSAVMGKRSVRFSTGHMARRAL